MASSKPKLPSYGPDELAIARGSFVLRAVGSNRRSSKAAAISVVLRTRSLGGHDQKGRRLDRQRLKRKVERHRGSRVGRARGSNRACRSPFLPQHRHKSPPTRSANSLCFFLPVS